MEIPGRLEQHARLSHPLAPLVVFGSAPRPRWPQSGCREYPAHRPGRQLDRLVGFGEAFGQVDRVEAGKRTRSRLDYLTATEFARPIDRNPTPVAVDESGGSLGPQPFGQPLDLTF